MGNAASLAGHGPLPLVTATEPFTASVSAKSMIFHFELVSKFRKIALFMLYYFQKGLFCSIVLFMEETCSLDEITVEQKFVRHKVGCVGSSVPWLVVLTIACY